jgi:hypothetical protein
MKTKRTTTKKKPAARPIPPPPPGWEIVGEDDPRLDCLPATPMTYFPGSRKWFDTGFTKGDKVPGYIRQRYTFALPIATQSATPQPAQASPPMIRLRLPSEKPTREENLFAVCRTSDGYTIVLAWPKVLPFDHNVRFWFSLPDGILPREPSHEEKWEAEAEEAWSQLPEATRPNKPGFIEGFLAAKKGGAK